MDNNGSFLISTSKRICANTTTLRPRWTWQINLQRLRSRGGAGISFPQEMSKECKIVESSHTWGLRRLLMLLPIIKTSVARRFCDILATTMVQAHHKFLSCEPRMRSEVIYAISGIKIHLCIYMSVFPSVGRIQGLSKRPGASYTQQA